jgi:indolepyruvate ferredoxin oxidoreductase alpha subunit
MHMAGEYNVESLVRGLSKFLVAARAPPEYLSRRRLVGWNRENKGTRGQLLGALPVRPPTFCVGCPERPVFSAMKLVAQDVGRPHVSMDVGCHAFASFEPFSQGNTLLGYGMSLAAAAGVGPMSSQRAVAVMGDGGFWHNGLLSGVASNLLNKGDGVLVIMKNGYASATGTQELLSSPPEDARMVAVAQARCTPTAPSRTRSRAWA